MTFQNSDSGSHVSGVPETTLAFSFPLGKGYNIYLSLDCQKEIPHIKCQERRPVSYFSASDTGLQREIGSR